MTVFTRSALALLLVYALWGCGGSDEGGMILTATQEEGVTIRLEIAACDGEVTGTSVREVADEVTVTVTAEDDGSDEDCGAAYVTVELNEPLGARRLLDGSTGKQVDLRM